MLQRNGALAILLIAVVAVVDIISGGRFLTPQNLKNVFSQISWNAILAVGEAFVIITAGIDLSVGSLIALTGVVMALVANMLDTPPALTFIITMASGLLVGCFAGFVNALPVVKLGLPPFITTLAMRQIAVGIAFIIAGGRPISVQQTAAFDWLGTGALFAGDGFVGIPWRVLLMLAVVTIFAVILGRTAYGRYVLADGGNEEAARLAGINVQRVKVLVYVISGGCAALAGLILMSQFSSGGPQTGSGYELNAIAAVVVGGTSLMGGRGSIIGTFFGALLLGVLNNVMNLMVIDSYLQLVVLGLVVLLAVIVDELRKRYLARA